MKFVCYTGWEQLPESASALFAQAARESLFFSRPWFECLTATALEADHRLVLACVVSGDNVMAVLPLMQCKGVKTWYSLRHGFTPIYNLLLAQDDQEQVITCLADGLTHLPVIRSSPSLPSSGSSTTTRRAYSDWHMTGRGGRIQWVQY